MSQPQPLLTTLTESSVHIRTTLFTDLLQENAKRLLSNSVSKDHPRDWGKGIFFLFDLV